MDLEQEKTFLMKKNIPGSLEISRRQSRNLSSKKDEAETCLWKQDEAEAEALVSRLRFANPASYPCLHIKANEVNTKP